VSSGAEREGANPRAGGRRRAARAVAWVVIPAALAALVFGQCWLFIDSTSETFDEPTYLVLGLAIFRRGNFLSLCSPMAPPLPILLEYWWPALTSRTFPESPGWEWEVAGLVRRARLLTSATVGVPLAWLVYAWLARRRGWAVAAIGGGLVAFSPSILASASLATTDACFALFAVLALAALARHAGKPSAGRFAAAGVALGLALASKQTGVILFPVALVVLFAVPSPRPEGKTRVDAWLIALSRAGARVVALVAIAFLVDWALYGFRLAPACGSGGGNTYIPVFVPMIAGLFPDGEAIMETLRGFRPPLALDTFLGQLDHASQGHFAFLMGQFSTRGWWYFFPVAIALKSTPAELVMFALAAGLAARRASWVDPTRRLWLAGLATLIGAGMASKLNIGHRYMLLAYPLAVLLAVDAIGEARARRRAWAWVGGGLLLVGQATAAIGIAPHYLGYFNGLGGGPTQGYRFLADSSLDWGQDLPIVRRELEARGYRKVALAYFGTASPRAHGLRSVSYGGDDDPIASGCDWLAISATSLQGVYGMPARLLDRFGGLPSARAGYSFFLYDLKDPRVASALGEFRRSTLGLSTPKPSGPGAPRKLGD